jgi:hypothetical protein
MASSGGKEDSLPFFPDDQQKVRGDRLEEVQRAQGAAASDLATMKELYLRQAQKLEAAAKGRAAAERRLADLTLICDAQEDRLALLQRDRDARLTELEQMRMQL